LLAEAVSTKGQSRSTQYLAGREQGGRGEGFNLFIETYEPKYPKATLCLKKDRIKLMAVFDFPAQHWQSIRTSNPIKSVFATIRHRTKRSKG
tara:strand:- start:428 stop:703 length:276 start_codon:yes stop_codon:yes gene_type:complete